MAKLKWASAGSRFYEAGIDKGVLYVGTAAGVPWDGLIRVSENNSSSTTTPYYMDGVRYYVHQTNGDFSATIEAYMYPPAFEACEGMTFSAQGLSFDNQDRKSFGLAYRTKLGSDTMGLSRGYKIHLIYNALAAPTTRDNASVTNVVDPMNFSWTIETTPVIVPGKQATAHLIIDSTRTKPDTLRAIEEILYGTATTAPRLPSPVEVENIFLSWEAFAIIPEFVGGYSLLDPMGVWNDIAGDMATGKYNLVPGTRLVETPAGSGFYTFG